MDGVWELAHAAWLNAQLHDDEVAEMHGLPPLATRAAAQVRQLLDGYRLPARERVGFVDKVIELAIHAARAESMEYQVDPDNREAIAPDGFPVLWAITWRTRDASWMLRNRAVLERAVR